MGMQSWICCSITSNTGNRFGSFEMKAILKHTNVLCLYAFLAVLAFEGAVFSGEPLKVFILAGQSNMEGQGEMYGTTPGHLETLVANDPVNYGHLKDGGDWTVRDDVWIWYQRMNADGTNSGSAKKGGLSAGYGRHDHTIGPELEFGNVMGDFYDAPVFILKFASGGKSLGGDFLPPSSGWDTTPTANGDRGYYYQELMNVIDDFKADPLSFCSGYKAADGYEIVGFGWHQGWNDRVTAAFAAAYEANMENFIKDVRAELGLPNLPFSISTTGMGGGNPDSAVEFAQLEMADFTTYPAFEGNVAADDTRSYWRDVSVSPSDQGYHWNRNAETYCLLGRGMGEGMIDMLVDPNAPEIDAGVDKITWSGEPVIMEPNVAQRQGSDWTNLTYKWTAVPDTGVVISNDQIAAPIVTITKATNNPSLVALVLEVNNAERTGHGVKNAVMIDVYDTACKAAIGKGLLAEHQTDIDGNCITDFADFAVLALQWLDSEVLTGAQKK